VEVIMSLSGNWRAPGAILYFAAFLSLVPLLGQEASVSEGKMTFRTYSFSDPDPVPLIGPIYPYFRFDGYSFEDRAQDWNMVRLENPYVRVLVAPEIGGKVWGAVEKSTGREFIYRNPVVKFREIAMRGPWTSGGIELNFGIIGHAPTTATPVDYVIQENADGSVSCIVGAIDLASRTVWRVNVRLPRDAAYIETECFWYNPTCFHDSLYNWLTSAQEIGEDLRFYYPGTHHIGHGGDAHPWPIAENGRDVSYYRNNDFGGSKSYHLLGEYNEYFGGYYEKSGFGYGHWAPYEDKPGMKLWIWSLARDGEIWRDLLTDRPKAQYVEPQAGLLYNQAGSDSSRTPFKHAAFAPQSVMRWKEIWFPVKDIGGLVAASPHAALNVERADDKLTIGLCPLRPIDDELIVTFGGHEVFRKRLVLRPMETFVQTVEVAEKAGESTVSLGRDKLNWSSLDREKNTLGRPLVSPADFNWDSAEGLYVAGEELARQRDYEGAMKKFSACLEKEPGHVRALTRVAESYFRRTDCLRALDYAQKALAIDAYDAGANFIYGVINRELGRYADAKDGFGWAARSLEFRSAAYEQLAEINLIEQKPARAAEYAQRSLDYNTYNLNARALQAILYRLGNNPEAAKAALDGIIRIDPLSHFARFERFLLDSSPACRDSFTSLIRGELPHESFLELAMFYTSLGLAEEAVKVLELAPPHPVVEYWLAYLSRQKDEARSERYLKKAEAASPSLVFPHRREDIPVLRWAAAQRAGWKARYYLGLILWKNGITGEARELFKGLGDSPDWGPFYLTRARLLEGDNNSEGTLADIQRAIHLDKEDWRAWRALTNFFEKRGNHQQALQSARAIYERQPKKPSLAMDYAKALLRSGKFRDCLKVLERTVILPYEGAWEGRDLYRQAHCFLAVQNIKKEKYGAAIAEAEKARLWPENLGSGKPFEADERIEDFIRAMAAEKMGDRDSAARLYSSVGAGTEKFRSTWDSVHFLGALALRKMGREEEAIRLLADWREARGGDDAVSAWALAEFRGDAAGSASVLAELDKRPWGAAWDLGTGDRYFPLVLEIFSAGNWKR